MPAEDEKKPEVGDEVVFESGPFSAAIVTVEEVTEEGYVAGPVKFVDYNPDECKGGGEHQWDGEWVMDPDGRGAWASCSKCGASFGEYLMRMG